MSICDTSSQILQFRNKSISELVQQLNNLGSNTMTIQHTTMIGVLDKENQNIRRFRSKSISNSRVSSTQKSNINANKQQMSQFFLSQGTQKKYYYNQIVNELEVVTIGKIMSMFQQGFNTTIVIQWNTNRFLQLMQKIQPWIEINQNDKQFYGSFVEYRPKQAVDLLSAGLSGKGVRTMTLVEASQKDNCIYQTTISQLTKLVCNQSSNINKKCPKILKILKKNQLKAQLNIILLPSIFFLSSSSSASTSQYNPCCSLIKSQLSQILTYLKSNPNKKYQNLNKLLPKRYPTTTAIAELLLYNNVNFVINWVADPQDDGQKYYNNNININENQNWRALINGRFQFFSKLVAFSCLVKKVDQNDFNTANMQNIEYTNKNLVKRNKSINNVNVKSVSKLKKQKQAFSETYLNNIQNKTNFDKTDARSTNQLQFCRSLQRKTHKYSIAQFQQSNTNIIDNANLPLFPQYKSSGLRNQLSQSQAIAIIKNQHAIQVSQYHQTIQNLNQKILVLTSEKNITQIFTIHQRQIMLLEMKIKELRNNIIRICSTNNMKINNDGNNKGKNNGLINQVQNLKQVIKRLNEEIMAEKKSHGVGGKIGQGKIRMMEMQLNQWKNKYQKSQIARKQLKLQLQAATNRLKLKDQQTKHLHQISQKIYKSEDLSSKQTVVLQQLQMFLKNNTNKSEFTPYIIRKFKNILGNVSQLRQIILQCHNFLTDLQEHIEDRLGQKDPEIVLDCNRFIRGYVINNLDIF